MMISVAERGVHIHGYRFTVAGNQEEKAQGQTNIEDFALVVAMRDGRVADAILVDTRSIYAHDPLVSPSESGKVSIDIVIFRAKKKMVEALRGQEAAEILRRTFQFQTIEDKDLRVRDWPNEDTQESARFQTPVIKVSLDNELFPAAVVLDFSPKTGVLQEYSYYSHPEQRFHSKKRGDVHNRPQAELLREPC
ncbi:MAG: hypothetical protein H6868_09540 [Rhodospirillales bacterium]|nr:hypothetical protein [Rhodospirillales bacterium]